MLIVQDGAQAFPRAAVAALSPSAIQCLGGGGRGAGAAQQQDAAFRYGIERLGQSG